jgi:hypothetical protein
MAVAESLHRLVLHDHRWAKVEQEGCAGHGWRGERDHAQIAARGVLTSTFAQLARFSPCLRSFPLSKDKLPALAPGAI